MSTSIDQRIVGLKFDNAQFEKGINQSTKSLDNFSKKTSDLRFLSKGLESLQRNADSVNLTGLSNGVGKVSKDFGFLENAASTAFGVIAAKAALAGSKMVGAFFTKPITDGFAEYEIKMGSIQTILANTSKYGTTLNDVTKSLSALNDYSDKTIYSFSDMTKNIGLFTNAGLKLEESTSMIKGFSNEAAASGANSQAAAGAAYQLSQALSSGTIRLMDWRSLTNAGMGNKNMQDGLIQIAQAMGSLEAAGISAEAVQADFNGSLEKGWLSADVMSKYLQIMAGDMDAAAMSSLGLSDAQIKMFQEQQKTAEEAATKVRTFTQLMSTIGESIGSGWAQSFEILFGNFDEATELFSSINDKVSQIIAGMTDSRNELLKSFVDLGGRSAIVKTIMNLFDAITRPVAALGKALQQVFSGPTASGLAGFAKLLEKITSKLVLTDSASENLSRVFSGLFSIVKIGLNLFNQFAKFIGYLVGRFTSFSTSVGTDLGGSLLGVLAKVGDVITSFQEWTGTIDLAGKAINAISPFLDKLQQLLSSAGKAIKNFWSDLVSSVDIEKIKNSFGGTGDAITKFGKVIYDTFNGIDWESSTTAFGDFSDGIKLGAASIGLSSDKIAAAKDKLSEFFEFIANGVIGKAEQKIESFKSTLEKFSNNVGGFLGSLNYQDIGQKGILGLLTGGTLGAVVSIFRTYMKTVKPLAESLREVGENLASFTGQLTDNLKSMQQNVKAKSLLTIAIAIGVLAASLWLLSKIPAESTAVGLATMGVAIGILVVALKQLDKLEKSVKMGPLALALLGVAAALLLISASAKILGGMDTTSLIQATVAIGVFAAAIVAVMRNLSSLDGSQIMANAAVIIALSGAVLIMAVAMKLLSTIPWEKALVSVGLMGAVIAAMILYTKYAEGNMGMIAGAISLIMIAQALLLFAGIIALFAAMPWDTFRDGAVKAGLVVLALAAALRLTPEDGVAKAALLLAATSSIYIAALAIEKLAEMPWKTFLKGFVFMAMVLAAIVAASKLMGSSNLLGAVSLLAISAALVILANALSILSEVPAKTLATTVGLLALALGVLIGVGYLASGAATGLLIFAAAIAALAAAFALLGGSMLILGAGLIKVTLALAGLSVSFLGIIAGLISMIPLFAMAVGQAFIVLLDIIRNNQASIEGAITTLIQSVVNAITNSIPNITNMVTALIDMVLNVIGTSIPKIIYTAQTIALAFLNMLGTMIPALAELGLNLIISLLSAIASKIGDVITTATDIIVAFLLGIANNLPRIIQAGITVIISFINGLADGVRNNEHKVRAAAKNLIYALQDAAWNAITDVASSIGDKAASIGENLVNGIANALNPQKIINKIYSMGTDIINAAKGVFGIHSPSKVFFGIGSYLMLGLANGIDEKSKKVTKTIDGVFDQIVDGFDDSPFDFFDGAFDDPTITPVVDLSKVSAARNQINGMFSSFGEAIRPTSNLALSANADSARTTTISSGQNGSNGPSNLTFNQYNTSPKALSAIDIYRQTRNQIAQAKALVGAN